MTKTSPFLYFKSSPEASRGVHVSTSSVAFNGSISIGYRQVLVEFQKMICVSELGLKLASSLMAAQQISMSDPIGVQIAVSWNPLAARFVASAITDIGLHTPGIVLAGYPNIKVWLAPDAVTEKQHFYVTIDEVDRYGVRWFEARLLEPSIEGKYVCAN